MISVEELAILNFYRASELAGAVLLGRLALQTTHDALRAPLTEQCAEEARHGWLFTKLITDLGAVPSRVTETYQSVVGKAFGAPEGILDILCVTRLLEVEAVDHYRIHAAKPGLHAAIRATLERVIEDEVGHVGWIDEELDRLRRDGRAEAVERASARAAAATRDAFAALHASPIVRAYFGDTLGGRDAGR
jgi:rubrerythrin